jgi:hypothetical protein
MSLLNMAVPRDHHSQAGGSANTYSTFNGGAKRRLLSLAPVFRYQKYLRMYRYSPNLPPGELQYSSYSPFVYSPFDLGSPFTDARHEPGAGMGKSGIIAAAEKYA